MASEWQVLRYEWLQDGSILLLSDQYHSGDLHYYNPGAESQTAADVYPGKALIAREYIELIHHQAQRLDADIRFHVNGLALLYGLYPRGRDSTTSCGQEHVKPTIQEAEEWKRIIIASRAAQAASEQQAAWHQQAQHMQQGYAISQQGNIRDYQVHPSSATDADYGQYPADDPPWQSSQYDPFPAHPQRPSQPPPASPTNLHATHNPHRRGIYVKIPPPATTATPASAPAPSTTPTPRPLSPCGPHYTPVVHKRSASMSEMLEGDKDW